MAYLNTEQRNKLAKVIVQARGEAEAGARVALEGLAVHHHEPYGHMASAQRKLRNRLRAHGRLLGDKRSDKSGAQHIDHLVQECAYEHWHRMLFARFLAENHLLIEPGLGVAVTLQDCEELAKDAGTDQWTLASRYAQRILPQVFRADHPAFELQLAREYRNALEKLIYSYWLRQQEAQVKSGVDGAQERLAAAQGLKTRLEAILKGEKPLDIFVRWKPIDQQPMGWEPDLNDGVRLNIRPFLLVDDVGKKGAGVLRAKPNIDWKKDRGKDVQDVLMSRSPWRGESDDVASTPWFPVFKGERINDHRLTLAEKQAARAKAGGSQ